MKKFIHGMALLCVLLFFGCETGTEYVTLREKWEIDYYAGVATEDELNNAFKDLENNETGLIAVIDDISLEDDLTIPDGITVRLLYGNLETGEKTLTVKGTLDVKSGCTLTVTGTDGSLVVENGGSVNVQTGGTLWLAEVDAANDGDTPSAETVLGISGKVNIVGGELRIKTVTADNVSKVFESIKSGLLRVAEPVAIKPSNVTNIGTSETRRLKMTVSVDEDAASLTILAGLDLTATGTLTSLTENITVDGEFTAESALTVADESILRVEGRLAMKAELIIKEDARCIGSGEILTESDAGKITFEEWSEAESNTIPTTYTADSGVNIADISDARKAIEAAVEDNKRFGLKDTFNSGDAPVSGIGSVEITGTKAADVQNTANGSEGQPIRLTKGTSLTSSKSTKGTSDLSSAAAAANFTLSLSLGKLVVTDSVYAGNNAKFGIVTFTDVPLTNRGLSGKVTFNIGVKTKRSS